MPVYNSTNPASGISATRGANVKKASNVAKVQNPLVDFEALSETATREKAIMSRLILATLSGTIFAVAAILTDSTWMAQLLAGDMHHRFHCFNRVHMEDLRTILADPKFAKDYRAHRVSTKVTTYSSRIG